MVSFQDILIRLHRLLPDFREPIHGDATSWQSG